MRSDHWAASGWRPITAVPGCRAGRVLTSGGRPRPGGRRPAIVLPGALTAGPAPRRAMRPHAGHGERRALDRGQDRGQFLAGPLGGLALLVSFLGSGGGRSQPVTHRAEPANLRPRLDDAIGRIQHHQHTEEATSNQPSHQYPAFHVRDLPGGSSLWQARSGGRMRQSGRPPHDQLQPAGRWRSRQGPGRRPPPCHRFGAPAGLLPLPRTGAATRPGGRASETGIRRKGPSGFSRIQIAWCAGY